MAEKMRDDVPFAEGESNTRVVTGVDWCELTVSSEMLGSVEVARACEHEIRSMGSSAIGRLARDIVTCEVSAARKLAADATLDTQQLFDRCLALAGKPFSEAPARRDMRERIRVFRRIARCGSELPRTLDDILDLWTEAMQGEGRIYAATEVAQFRTSQVPFGHGRSLFESADPPAGRETVPAPRIPDETRAMLAFIDRTDLPREVVAAASHFLCGHIHPFGDGNGHLARMLACILLADTYSTATILSLLRRLQADRGTMNLAMARTVRSRGDLAETVRLFLGTLRAAQCDVTRGEEDHAHLPLRHVHAEELELVASRRPGREVYRTSDGHIAKVVAEKGRLTRACSIYDAVSAAYAAGAAIARPIELVRVGDGYAIVLEFVEGQSLSQLVAGGGITPEEAGATLARCLRGLHEVHGDTARMRDIREPFVNMVDGFSQWLTQTTADACRTAILAIPTSQTLVHGDPNLGNVIVCEDGGLVMIDADTISLGSPVFDLGCAYSNLVCEFEIDPKRAEAFHGTQARTAHAIWQSLLDHYRVETDGVGPALENEKIELVAWMILLNRLVTVGSSGVPFGERMLRILQAAGCLSKAAQRVLGTCEE